MKLLWPFAALLMVPLTGCQLTHQQDDLLHQQIVGIGGWSNYDTRGWLIGMGHVTRATHRWVGERSTAARARGTQIDLVCVTNTASQVTILVSPGPVVTVP